MSFPVCWSISSMNRSEQSLINPYSYQNKRLFYESINPNHKYFRQKIQYLFESRSGKRLVYDSSVPSPATFASKEQAYLWIIVFKRIRKFLIRRKRHELHFDWIEWLQPIEKCITLRAEKLLNCLIRISWAISASAVTRIGTCPSYILKQSRPYG